MKRVSMWVAAIVTLLLVTAGMGVCADGALNYTLEDGVLTVLDSPDFSGELVLPTAQMGAVDKIVIADYAFSQPNQFESMDGVNVTAVSLTANEEIVIGTGAFNRCLALKRADLTANDRIIMRGDIDALFFRDDGCFEYSALERVSIRTNYLDMGEGYQFFGCDKLTDFSCDIVTGTFGADCFSLGYKWIPWIEAQAGNVYLGDVLVAYQEEAAEFVLTEKMAVDALRFNESITSIVMPDEMEAIPGSDFNRFPNFVSNLVSVKLSSSLKEIPRFCLSNLMYLTSVEIPDSVEKIGIGCFVQCYSLETLTIPRGTELDLLPVDFTLQTFNMSDKLTVTVYEGSPAEEAMKSGFCNVPYRVIPALEFEDPAVQRAAQVALGIDGALYACDTERLRELSVRGAASLADMKHFPNLEKLSVTYGTVRDLAPLADLTQLQTLSLAFNRIEDASPIADFAELQTLDLRGNLIADGSALAQLSAQTMLDYNYVQDQTPWISVEETSAKLNLPIVGGKWVCALYRDGAMVQVETLGNGGEYRVNVDHAAGTVIKVFLWEDFASAKPYALQGTWSFPVISSEYLCAD